MTRSNEPAELFEIDFTDGSAFAVHRRTIGDLEREYPWATLDPKQYPAALVARARLGWTENAFNEFSTAVAMGQLIQAFGQARVPLDLWSTACAFPIEELIHVELCSRVAMALGGAAPLRYRPSDLMLAIDEDLSPLERCNELVVRLCCVGEALSLPLLSGCLKTAAHPVMRGVLKKIVQDEARHGLLGWWYLDWIGNDLRPAERDRLGRVARETIEAYSPLWERLRSRVSGGVTTEGFDVHQVLELGWMDSESYAEAAKHAIESNVRAPLARYCIRM